jgi:hypothetical protein
MRPNMSGSEVLVPCAIVIVPSIGRAKSLVAANETTSAALFSSSYLQAAAARRCACTSDTKTSPRTMKRTNTKRCLMLEKQRRRSWSDDLVGLQDALLFVTAAGGYVMLDT